MIQNQNEEAIIRNLKDAGCTDAVIRRFLDCIKTGDKKTGLKLLDEHRKALLGSVHTGEKQIDYLDYFVFQFNKAK